MTDIEAAKIIAMLVTAYPKEDISPQTTALYIQFLLDIPYEAGKAAALKLIAESTFFPRVSELRKAAVAVLPQNRIPEPADAWTEVVKQLSSCGYYDAPKFTNDAIAKAVKALGWNNIRTSEMPDATRAHFLKIYDTYRNRAQSDVLMIPEARELENRIAIAEIKRLAASKGA